MCGIFGIISESLVDKQVYRTLVRSSEERGKDSSGLIFHKVNSYEAVQADMPLSWLSRQTKMETKSFVLGHSRLATHNSTSNQPVVRDGVAVLHNGIIVNTDTAWDLTSRDSIYGLDSELINAFTADFLESQGDTKGLAEYILEKLEGVVACAILIPDIGELVLFSNNGSLYLGHANNQAAVFASDRHTLSQIGINEIHQVREQYVVPVPKSTTPIKVQVFDAGGRRKGANLVPELGTSKIEEKLLVHRRHDLTRCTKCILPETMPYIRFDSDGVCNYCTSYVPRNVPKPKDELLNMLEQYRRETGPEAIVPFSGGRDSCYALHLIVKELDIRPVTFTYDWGMVTDLGRRNISRMSSELGVENIIFADDIRSKRRNIRMNLKAWLRNPDLGMISILTAGDKHFFRHAEELKERTGIRLDLWGINPLEVTHFKAGFLGIPPDFEEERVYSHGLTKQLHYQSLRFRKMLKSPGYFNTSIWDTLSGEYYRSFKTKTDYYHIFDYWRWNEQEIDSTLRDIYDWEMAPDTNTTWRIGDGTAAFYNYIYYSVAGFTEHDTFRSNQIREGDITRQEALDLVEDENQPRYPNIKWYLDAVGLEFGPVINTINSITPLKPAQM